MATGYDPKSLEKKWQDAWEKDGVYEAQEKGEKFYGLVEFPYPSGDGLHVGHPRSYTAIDIVTRKKRMEGKSVLYPIGWDAFGLPTENYAIKNKIRPQDATAKNVANFTRQLKSLGFGFDWTREVNTTDPAYYKWTQWMFLQFFKHGLAYKAKTTINWCPKDKIGLANEEAQGGVCERCGTPVEKREKEQWMIAITKYADRLISDLDTVDYLDKIKAQQINWIGKSEGANVQFQISNFQFQKEITVFTTRPDTLFGATFLVVSPEVAKKWIDAGWKASKDVVSYVEQALKRDEMSRANEEKEKTGVASGVEAVNPANGETIPVWVADYVLGNYGTGAIMAVPAHDERDFAFAKKFGLEIKQVVAPFFVDEENPPREGKKDVMRRNVQCIIYDPKKNAYLCLKWKKYDWKTFVIGGIEDDEDPAEAAKREALEETGYKHLRFVRRLGIEGVAKYFAAHKDENRTAIATGVLMELIDDEQELVSKEEAEKHDVVWIPADEVKAFVRGSELHLFWPYLENGKDAPAFVEDGLAINSGFLDGLSTEKAKEKMIVWLEKEKKGARAVTYKLRDWVFSRQRYWGEPIPIINCKKCGYVPVPDKELPVRLPDVEAYEPTDTGESPLAKIREWVEVECPTCGGKAERETDTMPNWAGSSWYFLRYCDPNNEKEFASAKKLKYWMPVDLYNGGMEHTTLHLLYSRFWYKFLWDIGEIPKACGSEPYRARRSHGLILGEGGEKMSKSRGNVVNPDDVVAEYGADVFRLYEMFIGPFDQAAPWDTNGIEGVRRFLEKVWKLCSVIPAKAGSQPRHAEVLLNQTIKKIGDDIEKMSFNTAVSSLMILANALTDVGAVHEPPLRSVEAFLKLLAPFAPHIAEELWHQLGHKKTIHHEQWPTFDSSKLVAETFELVVQVNGKLRDRLTVASNISEEEARAAALASEKVQTYLAGKKPTKMIYVPGRLISMTV